MLTYSPTQLILLPNKTETAIKILSLPATATYQIDLIKLQRKETQELIETKCANLKEGVITPIGTNFIFTTKEILAAISGCRTSNADIFALSIRSVTSQKNISAQENIIIPIIDESKSSVLAATRTTETTEILKRSFILEDLRCDKSFTLAKQDILCQTTVVNTTETPVNLTFITNVRIENFPSTTIYEKIEFSSLPLYPQTPKELQFTIPKETYEMGKYQIAASAAFTTFGVEAPSFITSQEATYFYLPAHLLYISIFALITISAILIKQLKNKFFTLTRWKKSPKV